jgi:DNA phosphorothioation-dependent restriction protein DptF
MTIINLRTALSVLAKSSPFSVKTVTDRSKDVFDELKEHLFVEQDIERDFSKILASLHENEIVFLSGSSGDGKSEILTRHYDKYREKYTFHLDATHSFSPRKSAIETLDELFDVRNSGSKPLVLGINIGMLANYAQEGAERHREVRGAIEGFLQGRAVVEAGFHFLDFEQYQKFHFKNKEGTCSDFAKELIKKLTDQSDDNPFYRYACIEEKQGTELQLVANFKLLSLDSVQEIIIAQLFKVRLIKDQFVTARALLDLLHYLLVGPGYIFDNLYVGDANELAQRLADFDPAKMHTQALDQFVLRYELSLPDAELDIFIEMLSKANILFARKDVSVGSAASLIRLFSLMRNESFGNDYHKIFKLEFDECLLLDYAAVWDLHTNYDGSAEVKMALRTFYAGQLVAALQRYANRNAPELAMANDELYLGRFGEVVVSAPIELRCDYELIRAKSSVKSAYFLGCIKVFGEAIDPIHIGFNLFELITKLNKGYRPNKYDKSAVVLLEEIVSMVVEIAKSKSSLKFYDKQKSYTAKLEDDIISIGGVV